MRRAAKRRSPHLVPRAMPSTPACPAEIYNPVPGVVEGVPSSRGYRGGFSSQLMVKDLRWGPGAPGAWCELLWVFAAKYLAALQPADG